MPQMRLDKLLSDMGIASRKELKQIIKSGRVQINGTAAVVPETKVDPSKDSIFFDGEELTYSHFHYYIMDKPAGVVTATDDKKQKTVLDLVSPEMKRMGLFPVGRLDKDTSGLLLLTDDGDFAHRVISPKSEVQKLYYAKVDGTPDETDIIAFKNGIVLKDGLECLPAGLEIIGEHECLVTVMEGKYHQVKRMLASRGKPVTELRRLSIGRVKLDGSLGAGGYRELTAEELSDVFLNP